MFFAPPKVKSLSRYAEYGAYLGNKHFIIMLMIAISAHLGVIAIYSMVPRQEIIRIPVRVLNIKLTGGAAEATHTPVKPSIPMLKAPEVVGEMAPAADEELEPLPESKPDAAAQKALAKTQTKPVTTHTLPTPPQSKWERTQHAPKAGRKTAHAASAESVFPTPKKYVRERDVDADKAKGKGHGKGTGNGGDVTGVAGGTEIIRRYTETISLWVQNHQYVAKARCEQAKESTGQCNAKGNVTVRIRIDRDGHIIKNTVDKSSGNELVDQLASQIVGASDPVPSVPNNYPESQLEFLVPVQVDLTAKQ